MEALANRSGLFLDPNQNANPLGKSNRNITSRVAPGPLNLPQETKLSWQHFKKPPPPPPQPSLPAPLSPNYKKLILLHHLILQNLILTSTGSTLSHLLLHHCHQNHHHSHRQETIHQIQAYQEKWYSLKR